MSGDHAAGHVAERVAEIVALVDAREARCGTTHLVAIDGPSGAGKTTLAAQVAAALAAPTVHMDDLYPGWDGLHAATARLWSWVAEPLQSGHPARYRRWDWTAGEYAEWVQLPPSEVIVLEGCGSGALPGGSVLSALVWVEADEAVRKARGLARDPGYAPFWDRWATQERALYAADRTRERADLVVDTTHERL
jgi:chloramphenicol 3-O-phosphotransferase